MRSNSWATIRLVKYVLFAVLLFAPLAVAGTYLSGDPTDTEAPELQLRTNVDSVPDKPKSSKSARKKQRLRSEARRERKDRVGGNVDTPRTATVAPRRRQAPANDDDPEPRKPGATPVPVLPPATAGPGNPPEAGDDEGVEDDDGEDGEGGEESGGGAEDGEEREEGEPDGDD